MIHIDRQFNARRDGLVTDARFNVLCVVTKLTIGKVLYVYSCERNSTLDTLTTGIKSARKCPT